MGYDWDDKREVCYRLYVDEKRSLEEVVEYFRDKLQFVPRYALSLRYTSDSSLYRHRRRHTGNIHGRCANMVAANAHFRPNSK